MDKALFDNEADALCGFFVKEGGGLNDELLAVLVCVGEFSKGEFFGDGGGGGESILETSVDRKERSASRQRGGR